MSRPVKGISDAEVRKLQAYYHSIILIMVFIGGLLFAGLVLLVESPQYITQQTNEFLPPLTNVGYFHFLSGYLAVLSGVAAMTAALCLMSVDFETQDEPSLRKTNDLVDFCSALVFGGFDVALGLMLIPIDIIEGISVSVLVTAFFVLVMSVKVMITSNKSSRIDSQNPS